MRPLDEIQEAFDKLDKPLKNNSALNDFLDEYFGDVGGELVEVPKDDLDTDPNFLDDIDDTVIKEFVGKVVDIWPDLVRRYEPVGNCADCPSSFIPVNRTFVVPGGRFTEGYYWDTAFILEGLLRTGGAFIEISKSMIENFLDLIEKIGFVPNGMRIYYMNRSQPPVLSLMVKSYIEYTGDEDILKRALPLLVKEHEFFMTNRSVEVKKGKKTFKLNRSVKGFDGQAQDRSKLTTMADTMLRILSLDQSRIVRTTSPRRTSLTTQNLVSSTQKSNP